MTRKSVSARIFAILTAVLTTTVLCLPAAAFAAGGVTKEETVYVVTDSSGTQQDLIVSDHLINNNKAKTIADQTNLTDIENVKGEETFKQKGEKLTWNAEGNGIYYQGRSEDEVPVSMDIVYRLNDKVVTGSELQGASGKVEISINYTNDAEVDGTTVPFVVMTGMVITDDSFKHININKGKVIDDGDKLMVVGMAAPGLAQTLDVGESELGIGSNVTITGDADNFAVEDMMTVVTNTFFEDVDTDELADLDYDDEIKQLDDGAKAVRDGSEKLYEGLSTMAEKMPDLQDGIGQLKDGSENLAAGTRKTKDGAKQIAKGTKDMSGTLTTELNKMQPKAEEGTLGAKSLYMGLYALKNGDGKTNPGLIAALTGINTAMSGVVAQTTELKKKADDADAALDSVIQYNGEAIADIEAAKEAAAAIQESDRETYNNIIFYLNAAEASISNDDEEKNSSTEKAEEAKEDIYNPDATPNSILEYNTIIANTALGVQTNVATMITNLNTTLGDESRPEDSLIGGSYALWQGLEEMQKKIDSTLDKDGELMQALRKLTKGTGDLASGTVTLNGGAQQLANGMRQLDDNTDTMADGVDQLNEGSYKLSKGMSQLYEQGIKKIVDMYNNDLKGTLDSAENMIDAGKAYKTFTRLPAGMDGNVKFIYRTDMTN